MSVRRDVLEIFKRHDLECQRQKAYDEAMATDPSLDPEGHDDPGACTDWRHNECWEIDDMSELVKDLTFYYKLYRRGRSDIIRLPRFKEIRSIFSRLLPENAYDYRDSVNEELIDWHTHRLLEDLSQL